MAYRERVVEGIIVLPNGDVIANGTLGFKLTKPIGLTSTHAIIDKEVFFDTDGTGKFSASLWVDEDSLIPVDYTVTLPIENNGNPDVDHQQLISLAWEDGSTKDYGILVSQSTPTDLVPVENLNSVIDDRFDVLFTTMSEEIAILDADMLFFEKESDGELYKISKANLLAGIGGGGSGMAIGGAVTGGTSGAVPFINSLGDLDQHELNFFFDETNETLKLGEAGYLGNTVGLSAIQGWANSRAFLKIGHDNAFSNNTQPVYAAQFDMKRAQTGGTGQQTSGIRPRAWIQATGGSAGIATAVEAFVENNGSTVDTMLQAIEGICQSSAQTVWQVGGWFQSGAGANVTFANWGIRSLASQSAGTAARTAAVEAILGTSGGGVMTDAAGIYIGGWFGTGILNSAAIKILADTNKGTVTSYAIKSLSTAVSEFAGAVRVPYEAYGVGYSTSTDAVTKQAFYETIEGLSVGGGGAVSPLDLTANNATETIITLNPASGQSVPLFIIKNGSYNQTYFDQSGNYISDGSIQMKYAGDLRGGWHPGISGFYVNPGFGYGFSPSNGINYPDVGLYRSSAGIVKVTSGDASAALGGLLAKYFAPDTLTNAAAPNNSVYYSSDNSKLVYKDGAGTVNNLY